MDVNKPHILFARVMHKRLSPVVNAFNYGIYYIAVPLSVPDMLADGWRFGVNRPGLMSFHAKDHGSRQAGADLRDWVRAQLAAHEVTHADGEIVLLTMPRVLGYVFNPVSFFLCHDAAGGLRAVVCSVNNTFGETHSYICVQDDGRVIGPDDWLDGQKVFHVSPFLHRTGHYRFRFNLRPEKAGIWIDYYDAPQQKKLLTSLVGHYAAYHRATRRRAFWRYPLVTLRAIFLIHWQALRLLLKKVKYIPKPEQLPEKTSKTDNITKN